MRKRTVHYRKSIILPGPEGEQDIGVPACGASGDVGNFELTTDKRKVTCENCLKTRVYKGRGVRK